VVGRKLEGEQRKHSVDGGQNVVLNPRGLGFPARSMFVGRLKGVVPDEIAKNRANLE
jgi:hypothetical protein